MWHKPTDKLPDEGERCLIVKMGVYSSWFQDGNFYVYDMDNDKKVMVKHVEYWQPLELLPTQWKPGELKVGDTFTDFEGRKLIVTELINRTS